MIKPVLLDVGRIRDDAPQREVARRHLGWAGCTRSFAAFDRYSPGFLLRRDRLVTLVPQLGSILRSKGWPGAPGSHREKHVWSPVHGQ